ncbi:unnamed protein product [Rhizophagus irregularis]|nr:unnamed protein product [Rhizophagus irregularis]
MKSAWTPGIGLDSWNSGEYEERQIDIKNVFLFYRSLRKLILILKYWIYWMRMDSIFIKLCSRTSVAKKRLRKGT